MKNDYLSRIFRVVFLFVSIVLFIFPFTEIALQQIQKSITPNILFLRPLLYMLETIIIVNFILRLKYNFFEIIKNMVSDFKSDFLKRILFCTFIYTLVGISISIVWYTDFKFNTDWLNVYSAYQSNSGDSFIEFIDSILGIFILGPFIEEVVFRYLCYNMIVDKDNKNKIKICIYIIASALSFGLLHFGSVQRILSAMCHGIGLAIIYLYTKNFLYTFLMHSTYNFIATTFKYDLFLCKHLFGTTNISFPFYLVVKYTIVIFIVFMILLIIYKFKNRNQKSRF